MKNKNFYKKIAINIANIADSKKARDIFIYDIENKNPLFYFAILLTAESLPHMRAIEEEISIKMKKDDLYISHRDGINSNQWKVLDYDGVIVHIFEERIREFYALDKVYSQTKKINWNKDISKERNSSKDGNKKIRKSNKRTAKR